MIVPILFAALGFVNPDGIVAPENVDVRIASNGVVEVRAPEGVEEVSLFWKRPLPAGTRVLRDDWERTYGAAGWTTVAKNPGSAWYMLLEGDAGVEGWGVMTQPNAFAWWSTSEKGITLTLDLRAGGRAVRPGKRVIEAVRLVMRAGVKGEDAWDAGHAFCRMMCPSPRLPKEPVYGYNDWYCAYGKNTATNFLSDATFVTSLAKGLANRPYVVMDDGWQRNSPPVVKPLGFGASGWGPWDEAGDAFGMKMKPFAAAVAALGAKPGLWYRPFRAWQEVPDEMRLRADPIFFDPSHPALRRMIVEDVRRFRDWGMKLVKIDYLTMDVAGGASYAARTGARLVPAERVWRDESRTTVEVLKDLYMAMREAAGDDMVIIGCNALNHLAAGLFELQRTGGDTSGWTWAQTREMGVNTLAARSIQDRAFFSVDADCVGLAQAEAVPWEMNRQWLELISRSGTALFVSWKKELATPEVREALTRAFAAAAAPRATARPLDWKETPFPVQWRFADGDAVFDWGTVPEKAPAFREELAQEEDYGELPEHFRLQDGYGISGCLESLRTTLDLLSGEGRVLELRRGAVDGTESHRIDVSSDRVVVTAEDDEGLRRAVYYVFDRVRAGDLASVVRKPWLKNRISRCYFGPIKRAPFFTDELMNDIDYYPEAYLDRLAHEGINGLWLTVTFADLAKTDYFPVSPTRERRLAKLRRTVEKCARYGIKTWLFFIEPKVLSEDDAFFRTHPETKGGFTAGGKTVLCSSAPIVRDYLEQATRSIFESVPGLGGAIAITHGERATSCLSEARPTETVPTVSCPACAKLQPWQIHCNTVGAMVRGMRAANPSAGFISWFYQPQPSPERGEWVSECARHLPEGVIFQYNFESGAEKDQLGKTRLGGDYWLSYEGPSRPFRRVAEAMRASGGELSAKIQVGCSHEVATVPYVPAPGLLYRKYRAMREAGVRDVMQCWYFGNYPGTMNAAAGALAFEEFKDGERAFLARLARPNWKGFSEEAGAAWEAMTRGYMEYPLSNQMQYYGPVHAGLTWPLVPDVEMKGLPRSWKPQDTPRGDTIGECLENHTVQEAIALFDRALAQMCGYPPNEVSRRSRALARCEADPLEVLEGKVPRRDWPRLREVWLMRTLRNQFESARNILEFYRLRAEAVSASRDENDAAKALALIGRMRRLVLRERDLGRETARFAFADSRLGYHSESEDHRFDAAKIQQRTEGLVATLARLDEITAGIRDGRPWPESAREREAPRWTGCRYDAAGDLVIEGDSPDRTSDKNLTAYLYDVCGTAFPRKYDVGVKDGRFTLRVPASTWKNERAYRPGWIMLDRVDDFWTFDGRRWPSEATLTKEDVADLRLNLWGVDSDRFGRLEPCAVVAENLETVKWQEAIDRASAAGGGTVVVPAGRHRVAGLALKSGVTLELAEGCVLEGSTNISNYADIHLRYAEVPEPWQAVVWAEDQTNIAVVGKGMIDGNGLGFGQWLRVGRPRGMLFHRCANVRVEGITMRSLASWTCYYKECDGVVHRDVKVYSHANWNTDGVDIEARNVLVENCRFDTGDDGIVLKSDNPFFAVEDVIIRNCDIGTSCNVFKIGTASHGAFRRIRFENVRGHSATGELPLEKDRIHCNKWRREGWPGLESLKDPLGGIVVECVDGACLEDVSFKDIDLGRVNVPIFIRAGMRRSRKAFGKPLGIPFGKGLTLKDVRIENVRATGTSWTASSITGVPGLRIDGVSLKNVEISVPGAGEAGAKDLTLGPVPEKENSYPESNMFDNRILPAYGFYIRHADNVRFENVRITSRGADPRPRIVTDDCRNFKVE